MEAREEEVRGLRMDVPEGEGEKAELAGLVERWPAELRLLRRAAGARG